MGIVIDLLKTKNNYLNRFSQLSMCQFQRIQKGDFSHINHFYRKRQALLKKIESIDQDIKDSKENLLNQTQKKQINELLNKNRKTMFSILKNDLCIHCSLKEREQSLIKDQSA